MNGKNCFRISSLVVAPLLFVATVAHAASIPIPSQVVINQPGMVYMATGEDQNTLVALQVSGLWPRSLGYQFGYVGNSVFSTIINGNGTKQNLSFQAGTSVNFAVRNKGDDGMFGTTDDVLFKLTDATGYTTQLYSNPLKGSNTGNPADYSKLTLQWDFNGDAVNDLTVFLKASTCDGLHFAASPTPVPVPAALWLLGSGFAGLTVFLRRRKTP